MSERPSVKALTVRATDGISWRSARRCRGSVVPWNVSVIDRLCSTCIARDACEGAAVKPTSTVQACPISCAAILQSLVSECAQSGYLTLRGEAAA